MPGETSQTLDRGLRVLSVLAERAAPMTATALAAELDLNRTVVHRLVSTLESHGLVRRDGEARIGLGVGLLGLVDAVWPWVRAGATPVLRRLADDAGATAHLTVAEGVQALAVAVVEPSWTDFHVAYRVGSRHPLARGAAGRALSAPVGTYVCTQGELQPGAHGLAAPVAGVPGLVGRWGW